MNEWLYEMRVWILVLKSALDENNKDLARDSIKEVVTIIGNISYVYGLWDQLPPQLEVTNIK